MGYCFVDRPDRFYDVRYGAVIILHSLHALIILKVLRILRIILQHDIFVLLDRLLNIRVFSDLVRHEPLRGCWIDLIVMMIRPHFQTDIRWHDVRLRRIFIRSASIVISISSKVVMCVLISQVS